MLEAIRSASTRGALCSVALPAREQRSRDQDPIFDLNPCVGGERVDAHAKYEGWVQAMRVAQVHRRDRAHEAPIGRPEHKCVALK